MWATLLRFLKGKEEHSDEIGMCREDIQFFILHFLLWAQGNLDVFIG